MTASTRISRRTALAALAGAAVGGPTLAATAFSHSRASAASPAGAPRAAACSPLPAQLPSPGSLPSISELPDPFRTWEGTRLTSPDEWACRRAQLSELIQNYEYGHLPAGSATGSRNGSTLTVNARGLVGTASFTASVRLPSGTGPFPALILLNGLAASATSRGYAEVTINPNAIAADGGPKTGAFWKANGTGVDTGGLMAWAWGVHRTLDAIESAVPEIDATRVGVSGYSRYGKAALVAGAFDERIALTVPGSSGTAGMGNYRFFYSNDREDIDDIVLGAPYWITSEMVGFAGRPTLLPIDQHSVAALVAPRPLLTTNGTEGSDIRTNPQGAAATHRAARMVYTYLGAEDRIGIAYRPGGHQLDFNDFNAIMDFADWHLQGRQPSRDFDQIPYPEDHAAIPWTIPS